MRKLLSGAASAMLLACMVSCGNDFDPETDGHHRHPNGNVNKLYRVALSLGGDYVQSFDEPLVRAGENAKTYVGINVTRVENGQSDDNKERFAYGVFEGKDNIMINLYSGYRYDFEATVLIDGTDEFYRGNGEDYSYPFVYSTGRDVSFSSHPYRNEWIQDFQYTFSKDDDRDREYLTALSSGTAWVKVEKPKNEALDKSNSSFPRVNRYYGAFERFEPGSSSEIHIDMKYKCFGIRFEVESIPEGTYLTVEDRTPKGTVGTKEEHEYLQFPNDLKLGNTPDALAEWEDIYSFNNLNSTTGQFTLRFTWHRADGTTQRFSSDITVSPKVKKTLKINIDGNPNTMMPGNVVLDLESDEMTEDPSKIVETL